MFPVCSFCGDRPVRTWFEGPDFTVAVDSADRVTAEEAWLACAICSTLVRSDDREALVRRGLDRARRRGGGEDPDGVRERLDRFWSARSAT
jgi:hypothetical protein